MSRVKSKNLFNFAPVGSVDEDVLQHEAAMFQDRLGEEGMAMVAKIAELTQKDDEKSTKEYLQLIRALMSASIQELGKHPVLQKYGEETVVGELKVPTVHDESFDVPVAIYTPKKLQGKLNNSAFIYAHGGGAVAMTAHDSKPGLDMWANIADVVVFNVDYRLAPETKCPNNIKDFYEAIKYISKNAVSMGIDPDKIAIAGDSGGGYICLGAMVLLAQNDEEGLIKLAMPGIPMVDDYHFSDPAAMTNEERENALGMRKIWKMIAADFETQKHDPHLFPGKATDDILAKFPPTIIIECEFDMFITEATRLATRLRRVGRLLEFLVIPGAKHATYMNPALKCFKIWESAMKQAVDEYLHK